MAIPTIASETTPDELPTLPDEALEAMPEYIFDTWHKMLWRLEVDGMYGLEASNQPCAYLRRSIREIQEARGEFVALATDRRARDTTWQLTPAEPQT